MKKTLFLFIFAHFLTYSFVSAQITTAHGAWQWTKSIGSAGQIGGANQVDEKICKVTTDAHGNTYVCGQVFGFPHIKGLNGGNAYGQISNSRQQPNYTQGFAAKYDCDGNLKWFKTLGDSLSPAFIFDITVDTAENVYLFAKSQWGFYPTYWGDSLVSTAIPQNTWPTNGTLFKTDKNGHIIWTWSMAQNYGINTTVSFRYIDDSKMRTDQINNSYLYLVHDTLVFLAALDTVYPQWGLHIFDFNTLTGQLLNTSKIGGINIGSGYWQGFAPYGNGTFIAAVNFTSPTHQILDSVVSTPMNIGRGMIFTFSRTHFMQKLILPDSAGINDINLEKSFNGFCFVGGGNRGQKWINNQYTLHAVDNSVFNLKTAYPLILLSDLKTIKWAVEADSSNFGAFIGIARKESSQDILGNFVIQGITNPARTRIGSYVFTSPVNINNNNFIRIKNTDGTFKNIFSSLPLSNTNTNVNFAHTSDYRITEKGNLSIAGNFKNNNILIPNKDTTQFFGGNNDLFIIKWGNDCVNDTALIAPAPPQSLTANCTDNTKIILQWQDISTLENGYKIYKAIGTSSYSLLTTLPSNSTSYQDMAVAAGTTYHYRVAAYNNIDTSYTSSASKTLCIQDGIKEVATTNGMSGKVYPNPVQHNEFMLVLHTNKINQQGTLQIQNPMGQILYSQPITINNTDSQWQIKLSTPLTAGIYLLSVKTKEERCTERVLVVR